MFEPNTTQPKNTNKETVKPNAYHLDNIIDMLIYNMGYFGAGKDLIKRKAVMMLNRYDKKGRDIRYAVPSPLKIDPDSELIELINNIRTLCGGVSDKKKSVNKVINVRVGGKEYSEIKSDEDLGRIYTISLDDVHDETVSLDEFKDFYRNFTWDGKSKLDDGYIEKLYKEYTANIADISPKFSVEDVESLGYKK